MPNTTLRVGNDELRAYLAVPTGDGPWPGVVVLHEGGLGLNGDIIRQADRFAEHGYERLVRRARSMLGDAGAPVPRRGRGESEVPTSLRALGVTSRELDPQAGVAHGRRPIFPVGWP